MPVERDDEQTSFDLRPWGAQQRVLPAPRFQAPRRLPTPVTIITEVNPVAVITAPVFAPDAAVSFSTPRPVARQVWDPLPRCEVLPREQPPRRRVNWMWPVLVAPLGAVVAVLTAVLVIGSTA